MYALVSSGTSNLGSSICSLLVKTGYTVFSTYYSNGKKAETLEKELGIKFFQVDSCNSNQIKNLYNQLPTLDLIVNNTGIFSLGEQEKLDESDFDMVIDTNIRSVFLFVKYGVSKLKNPSSIINICSINAFHPGFGQTAHYDGTKGFVYSYTKSLAAELGPKGISVNAIAPGLIKASYLEDPDNEVRKKFLNRAVLKKLVEPEEIAKLVVMLSSIKSITGETIAIDCGYLIG